MAEIEKKISGVEERKRMVEGEYPYNYFRFMFRDEGCLELIAQRKENVKETFEQIMDQALSPKDKQIITGLFEEKLTYLGIAKKIGMSGNTVKLRLHKITRMMRSPSRSRRILYDADVLEERHRQAVLKREEEKKAALERLKSFDDEFLDSPIDVLNLSKLSYVALKRSGILRVRELLELNDGQIEEHLMEFRLLQGRPFAEILDKLKSLGVLE